MGFSNSLTNYCENKRIALLIISDFLLFTNGALTELQTVSSYSNPYQQQAVR